MDKSKHLSFIKPIINRAHGFLEYILPLLGRLKKLNIILFIASIALFSFLVLGRYGRFFSDSAKRFTILGVFVLGGALLLKATGLKKNWGVLLLATLLFVAFGYKIASYANDISTYPFSLGWSEGSRYYYASLFFSERIYAISVPPTVLHPTRYLMQSVPFLIPDSPIWLHRLWQVMLWIITTLTTAFLLARRLSIPDRLRRWVFIAWVFLFLLLGPVFYHLQVSVILVLLLFDHRKFWQSLLAVLLASAWAGFSRVNWYPVPGMLATTIFFLETPVGNQSQWRYLIKPILWIGLGIGVAFFSQSLYAIWSGNPAELFASSFTSDLLWYRLLPNATYRIGVLPAALLLSSPVFLLMADWLKGEWRSYHPIRLLGVGAILLVLFAGGLVVSTKIGGGSNLHNLDAYFVLLLVVTAYIYFGDFVTEHTDGQRAVTTGWVTTVGLILALLLPVYITINSGTRIKPYDQAETEAALITINRLVRNALKKGDEVLVIDERQLITFGDLENTTLVPDYEKVFLTEMAMAGNEAYLNRFHEDIENQRFALIMSETLFINYKDKKDSFAEENNAWVKWVSEPVLCYYVPKLRLKPFKIQMLIPRNPSKICTQQ